MEEEFEETCDNDESIASEIALVSIFVLFPVSVVLTLGFVCGCYYKIIKSYLFVRIFVITLSSSLIAVLESVLDYRGVPSTNGSLLSFFFIGECFGLATYMGYSNNSYTSFMEPVHMAYNYWSSAIPHSPLLEKIGLAWSIITDIWNMIERFSPTLTNYTQFPISSLQLALIVGTILMVAALLGINVFTRLVTVCVILHGFLIIGCKIWADFDEHGHLTGLFPHTHRATFITWIGALIEP